MRRPWKGPRIMGHCRIFIAMCHTGHARSKVYFGRRRDSNPHLYHCKSSALSIRPPRLDTLPVSFPGLSPTHCFLSDIYDLGVYSQSLLTRLQRGRPDTDDVHGSHFSDTSPGPSVWDFPTHLGSKRSLKCIHVHCHTLFTYSHPGTVVLTL